MTTDVNGTEPVLPEPLEAANERSPNRKPRYRAVMKLLDTQGARRAWLRFYRVCGDPKLAAARVDRSLVTVHRWRASDQAFRAEWDEIDALWKDVLEGKLQALDAIGIEVFEATMRQTDDKRLRYWASERLLRAHGLMPDRVIIEDTRPRGVVVNKIIIMNQTTGEATDMAGGPIPTESTVVDDPKPATDTEA